MANPEHLDLLLKQASAWQQWKVENPNKPIRSLDAKTYEEVSKQVFPWNVWRSSNPSVRPDLSVSRLCHIDLSLADLRGVDFRNAYISRVNLNEAHLTGADLRGADLYMTSLQRAYLSGADFSGAKFGEGLPEAGTIGGAYLSRMELRNTKFSKAYLYGADFSESDLTGADLSHATLTHAKFSATNLRGADLIGAHLYGADFAMANLEGAKLSGSDLRNVHFVDTNLDGATITGSKVYGISAWNLKSDRLSQSNLTITRDEEPSITVDNLEVAQFLYLLLNNRKLREVIDTVGKKAVLILGRFTPERKVVLDAIREALRERGYLPILFDFDVPAGRDITETVSTLAHLSRFIIADITDAKSIPQELQAIVPQLPSVPVQPLLHASRSEYGMFEHFKRYPWVLSLHIYDSVDELLASISKTLIEPAEAKLNDSGLEGKTSAADS